MCERLWWQDSTRITAPEVFAILAVQLIATTIIAGMTLGPGTSPVKPEGRDMEQPATWLVMDGNGRSSIQWTTMNHPQFSLADDVLQIRLVYWMWIQHVIICDLWASSIDSSCQLSSVINETIVDHV